MFSHLKISAILVGLFAHVVSSVIILFLSIYFVKLMNQSANPALYAIISLLIMISVRTVGFLAIGYLTAYIARTQPLLHAFVCGCFVAVFEILLGHLPFLAVFLYIPGFVTGAWLYRISMNKKITSS
jgi:hypothetical protein